MSRTTLFGRLALATLGGMLLLGAAMSVALADTPQGMPERVAAIVKSALSGPAGPTVATVNGLPVTTQRLQLEVAVRNAQGANLTRAQVLDDLINQYVVLSEARRRGISVSDASLATFIAQQKAAADADPERAVYRYAAALGVPDAAVWSYPPFVQTWRDDLTYGALKHAVLGQVTPTTLASKESEWSSFVAQLRASADIRRAE